MGHGGSDVVLTERGEKMADLIGIRLKDVEFDKIYVSDLLRTVQTSKFILKYNKCKNVEYTKELRERNLGDLEGKTSQAYKESLEKSGEKPRLFTPNNGESWKNVFVRIKRFLNLVINSYINSSSIGMELNKQISEMTNNSKFTNDFMNSVQININKKNSTQISDIKSKESKESKEQIVKSNTIKVDDKKFEFKLNDTIKGGALDDSFAEDHNFNIIIKNNREVNEKNDKTNKNVIKSNKFTFKEDKNNITKNNEKKYEYYFLTRNINDILNDKESLEYIEKKYIGYNKSTLKRVLLVTHGGLIMELLNVIRHKKGISPKHLNDTKFTGLYCVRIYCGVCGGECEDKKDCYLEYDFVIFNSSSHLGKKIEIQQQ